MDDSAPTTTLLAIDDDHDILKVLQANLELHGFKLLTAASLAEARQILETLQPDLIILDLMLPDGDGLEFCCSLKSIHPQLPVIMLTARDKVSDKVVGLELGADDYVVKPFETSELLARIKARLRASPGGTPNPVIRAGDLEVDLRNQTVSVAGREVYLTAKEFQLLACLVENRNNLVTRDEIRKRLWRDSKIYSWSRVIDVHIQHLRQKIEKNPSRPRFIITVPGRGYRFAEE